MDVESNQSGRLDYEKWIKMIIGVWKKNNNQDSADVSICHVLVFMIVNRSFRWTRFDRFDRVFRSSALRLSICRLCRLPCWNIFCHFFCFDFFVFSRIEVIRVAARRVAAYGGKAHRRLQGTRCFECRAAFPPFSSSGGRSGVRSFNIFWCARRLIGNVC